MQFECFMQSQDSVSKVRYTLYNVQLKPECNIRDFNEGNPDLEMLQA